MVPKAVSAGFFDWLEKKSTKNNETVSEIKNSSWSFDMIYGNIIQEDDIVSKNMFAIIIDSIFDVDISNVSFENTYIRKQTYVVEATGYSSTYDQTDATPFITAHGTYVRDGIIATNFLPFGTIVKIPRLFDDKIFVVEDRMNDRYWRHIDIWFSDRNSAIEFGRQEVKIEVISS